MADFGDLIDFDYFLDESLGILGFDLRVRLVLYLRLCFVICGLFGLV